MTMKALQHRHISSVVSMQRMHHGRQLVQVVAGGGAHEIQISFSSMDFV